MNKKRKQYEKNRRLKNVKLRQQEHGFIRKPGKQPKGMQPLSIDEWNRIISV